MACITCGRAIREDQTWTCPKHKLKFAFCDQHVRAMGTKIPECPQGGAHAGAPLKKYNGKLFAAKQELAKYTWHVPAYLAQVRDTRAVLKQHIRAPGPEVESVGLNLAQILAQDFIITHETTWVGLSYMLARGGADCQARILKHAPNTQSTHRDSVNGGGHFVYTRIVSARGPNEPLNLGSQGAASPIMLVFSKALLQEKWKEMFGANTDLYGAIGQGAQTPVTLSGADRGAMALEVALSELTAQSGPSLNNEFGFFSRIDFKYLRAIVVKLDQASTNVGIDNLPSAQKIEMRKAAAVKMSEQKGRIAPNRPRNASDVYGAPGAPVADDLLSSEAFLQAFGRSLSSIVVGLAKSTRRSSVGAKLTALGL